MGKVPRRGLIERRRLISLGLRLSFGLFVASDADGKIVRRRMMMTMTMTVTVKGR